LQNARNPVGRRLRDPHVATRRPPTGNFFIDDVLLRESGVIDLDRFSVTPGTTDFVPDFFVD
jgi:hypothetical protein